MTQHRHLKMSNLINIKKDGKGPVLFTGPDGICDHNTQVLGPTEFVGIGTMSPEGTSNLAYLWRPATCTNRRRTTYGKANWDQTGWHLQIKKDEKRANSAPIQRNYKIQ
eukprot:TCONS_00009028-protein